MHVAANDGDLDHEPYEESRHTRVEVVGNFGEIAARNDANSGGQPLEEEAKEVGRKKDPQQFVLGNGPRLEIAFDVARVQIGDAHQEARPGEGP